MQKVDTETARDTEAAGLSKKSVLLVQRLGLVTQALLVAIGLQTFATLVIVDLRFPAFLK
ncbi:MAG: hypothetical protein ACI8T1_002998 [Verrucomicrobiales bacterium]|jgi:hypothetical protein